MNGVRDKADDEAGRLEHAPQDIIGAIELFRTAVAEMSEAGCAGFERLDKAFTRRVGMAEADFHPQSNGVRNGGNRICSLRRDGDEQRIVADGFTQVVHVLRRRIEHERRIVRATKAGFRGKKRTFNVPANDGALKRCGVRAQFAQMRQTTQHHGPLVGNERQKKAGAAGGSDL